MWRRTVSGALALVLASGCEGGSSEPAPTPAMAALTACAPVQPPVIEAGEPLGATDVVVCVGAPRADGSSIVRVGARSLGSGSDGRLDEGELAAALGDVQGRRVTIVADAASAATTTGQIVLAAADAEASVVELGSRGPEGLRVRHLEGPPPVPYPDLAEEPASEWRARFLHVEPDEIVYADTLGTIDEAGARRDPAALREFVDELRVADPHWDHPLTLVWIAGTTYADLVAVVDVVLERFGVVLDASVGGPERWAAASVEAFFGAMHAPIPTPEEVLAVLRTPSYPTATDPTGPPHVELGDLFVRGAISAAAIERGLRHHHAEVLACYEAALEAHPALSGHVTIAMIVSEAGVVTASNVAATTMNVPEVEACLRAAARTWTFPAPRDGGITGVNAPFAFDRGTTP